MVPSIDNIATCVGELFGLHGVTTLESLEEQWQCLQPTSGLRLRADASRDRFYISVRCDKHVAIAAAKAVGPDSSATAKAAGAFEGLPEDCGWRRLLVELVLASELNHAYVVHHWAAPPWQAAAAKIALDQWCEDWWESHNALPCAVLMAAMLQPLLASKVGGGREALGALSQADAQRRRRLIRLGLYVEGKVGTDWQLTGST